jgi:hypothetical protein
VIYIRVNHTLHGKIGFYDLKWNHKGDNINKWDKGKFDHVMKADTDY